MNKNYDIYKINKDDVELIEAVAYFWLEKPVTNYTKHMTNQLIKLAEKGNLEAMNNLMSICDKNDDKENTYKKYYEKFYNMNYYRRLNNYVDEILLERKTLDILKKNISNGYYSHIKNYNYIFMMINEIEDIFKSPPLKSEFIFIFKAFINNIILDDMSSLIE